MAEPERKLAAILAADVVGYSRLLEADPQGTIDRINAHRRDLIDPLIAKHRWLVLKRTGDGALVEFASVEDAVQSAVDVQREMAEANASVPADKRIEFRIGIEIGDVIYEADDFHGTGVIIASRIEGLAEPGGICITESVFNRVRNLVDAGYVSIGEQCLKNIAEPITVYRVMTGSSDAGVVRDAAHIKSRRWAGIAEFAAFGAVVLALGGVYWTWATAPRPPASEAASIERMAFPLPDKPSIAVLPFVNLSGDPADEFLPDGISEDITTSLSKLPALFVISRTTTATYKERDVTVKQVAEELGVRYVLEGSVQRQGERMRVTAQLIDALSGGHVWADSYDRDMTDLFAVKDEITLNVVSNVGAELEFGERDRRLRSETDSLEAWLLYREGRGMFLQTMREGNVLARDRFERAIAIDPDFLSAYAMFANTHSMDARRGWTDAREAASDKALEILSRNLEKDPTHAFTYSVLTYLYLDRRQHDLALEAAAKAVELDPNDYVSHGALASALLHDGAPLEAIPEFKAAMRLSPIHPDYIVNYLSESYILSGDLDQALQLLDTLLARPPSSPSNEAWARALLAVVYDAMNRQQEARDQVARLVQVLPPASISMILSPLSLYKDPSTLDGWAETWRRLGMPE